jgi:hypothetical protein
LAAKKTKASQNIFHQLQNIIQREYSRNLLVKIEICRSNQAWPTIFENNCGAEKRLAIGNT